MTIILEDSLPINRYRLEIKDSVKSERFDKPLNGEFINVVDELPRSGDETSGGDFNFNFVANPGDVDGHFGVDFIDQAPIIVDNGALALFTPGYNVRADTDGNGGIDFIDAAVIVINNGALVPSGFPGLGGGSSVVISGSTASDGIASGGMSLAAKSAAGRPMVLGKLGDSSGAFCDRDWNESNDPRRDTDDLWGNAVDELISDDEDELSWLGV